MTITVHLFATAREWAGRGSLNVQLDAGATVGALRRALQPTLKELLDRCAIAVNHEFANDDVELKETDEVAVIPPVSGG